MILYDARDVHDAREVRLGFAHHDSQIAMIVETLKQLFVHWQAVQFT